MKHLCFGLGIILPLLAPAQLVVSVSSTKITGQKAVAPLSIKSSLTNGVESARATMFLLDGEGKVLAQSTKWVIGGEKDRLALQPGKEATYNFVFTVDKPFASTKLTFNRVVLEGGKTVDPIKNVQIVEAGK
jgi:hypothetical protein